jgi:drug/metabolite transporter (DMT)-like permease
MSSPHDANNLSGFKAKIPMVKLFLAPVIWGGALSAARIVSAELPAFTTSFVRFFIASILMIVVLYIKEKKFPKPTKRDILWMFLLSLVGMVFFNGFLFTSLQTITAVRSSVLLAFTPVVVAIAARFIFKEKITPLMLAGIIAAIIGAVLTITEGDLGKVLQSGLAIGDIYMLGAVLSWAAYSIIIKVAMSRLSPLALLAYGSVIGVILLFPFTLYDNAWSALAHLSTNAIWSMLFLSIGAAGIAYLWYYEGIAHVGSSKASVFLNMEPVAAIAIGVILLGEELTIAVAIGALLVIGGLFLTNHKSKPRLPNS